MLLVTATTHALAQGGEAENPPMVPAAQGPLDLVRSSVFLVLSIVRSQPDSVQRRIDIRHIGEALFDFNEMARRTLGPHWDARSAEEQRTFVLIFTDMLERSYMTAIGSKRLATITFQGETIEGSSARVQSLLVTARGAELPMEYRLLESRGRWTVYDVVVDGASIVSSYRSQFDSILRTSSFDHFLDKLQNREARGREAP